MKVPPSLRSKFFIDGFFSPLKVLSSDEALQLHKDYQKYVEKFGNNGKLEGDHRFRVHLLANWANSLVHHPTIISAVKTALDSPNILCWSTDLCIKPANSDGFFSWHQDSTYSGLAPPHKVVTAWVALTPSTASSGCMQMLPSSHLTQMEHLESKESSNLLSLGQYIPDTQLEELLGSEVLVELQPGEVSLHSWRCVHKSGPNTTNKDRVGFAIRYMTDEVENTKMVAKERATLVCGNAGFSWDLETGPSKDYGKKEMEEHKQSMESEKKNYFDGKETQEFK